MTRESKRVEDVLDDMQRAVDRSDVWGRTGMLKAADLKVVVALARLAVEAQSILEPHDTTSEWAGWLSRFSALTRSPAAPSEAKKET